MCFVDGFSPLFFILFFFFLANDAAILAARRLRPASDFPAQLAPSVKVNSISLTDEC